MSFMFSKNREKRSRTASGESNSSFVKKVTSRVSGFLPAGITKWFSSPSSSSGNGSAAVADGTDSSTEDEAPESPTTIPLAKRARYSSPGRRYSQLTTSETTTTSNVETDSGSVLYSSIQIPPVSHAYKKDPNLATTPIQSPTPNPELISPNALKDGSEKEQYKQHTVSAIGQSIARKRKSLFDSDRQKEQSLTACAKTAAHQVKEYKQPYFKSHLMGSPFYPGRTMYGGASASYPSSCYVNHSNIMQHKMTYVNESKSEVTVNMSTSSRQVMDLLENYSSPLIEAKRIPRYELSELTDINRTMPGVSKTCIAAINSLKKQELYMPSKASLILMKARSRVMNSTKAARQIIASHSSSLPFFQPNTVAVPKDAASEHQSGQSKSSSKLKSRLTRTHCGGDPFEIPEAVKLPTAILRIDQNNLPTFSFGSTVRDTSGAAFTFSNPLPATSEAHAAHTLPPAFDFGSPRKAAVDTSPTIYSLGNQFTREKTEAVSVKPLHESKSTSDTQTTTKTVIAFAKASNEWECSDCWVSNKADALKCICCGSKQPTKESKTGSGSTSKCATCKHADSLSNSDKCATCVKVNCEMFRTSPKTSNFAAVPNKSSSTWKCGDCWVDNEENSEKCVCCGSKNPKKTGKAPVATHTLNAAAVPVESDWRCEDCLITNKPTIVKCAACGGAKPGTKRLLPSIAPTAGVRATDDKFAEIINAQKCSWECRVCLASNANEDTVCSCCETAKHGATNDAPKLKNFKFNMEHNTGFKFGIDPKVQEMGLSQKFDMLPAPKKLEESETNNNVVPKMPSFTMPTKKLEEMVDLSKTNEIQKPSFSFGIPAQTASLATGFVPTKAPSSTNLNDIVKPVEDKEKPQEVPSIAFHAPEAKQPPGWFSSPAATANSANAMNAFLNNSTEKTKAISTNEATQPAMENLKPQFSFSASPATPSTGGMFSSQASGATTLAPTTAAPAAFPELADSLFSKHANTRDASAAPPSTMFQNTRDTPSATPPAPTPIFSFGTSQSVNAAQATDTTINFSFSSSNPPAFGATQQAMLPASAAARSNGPSASNPLAQSVSGNVNSGSGLASNGNALLAGGASLFNTPAKESSMWPSAEQRNPQHSFVTSTPAKPAFSFGAPAAGATAVAAAAPSPFGGSAAPPAQSMFGMSHDGVSQPMFPASQPAAPMFGAPSISAGMFAAPNSNAMASFDSPAPAFNFGGSQAASGVFGFGQQGPPPQPPQQQIQAMQPNSFGFAAPAAGQMQFAIGSAPNQSPIPARRYKKAVRRNR